MRTVLIFSNPLEDAETTLPLDEAAQLSRRLRLVELSAHFEEAKALTPIQDDTAPLLLEVLEVPMVATGLVKGGTVYLYTAINRKYDQEILPNVMEARERRRGGLHRDGQITVTLAR